MLDYHLQQSRELGPRLISGLFQMSEVQERMEEPLLTTNSKMEGKMDMTSERNEAVPGGKS
jgi:hypothetical protein